MTLDCCRISSDWRFALFCGGCYIIDFIDHVSLLFPSVHSSSHSFHLSQSILFIFILFGCIHITWSFNHIVSFTFQPIPSLGISNLRVSLDKFLILDRYSLLEAELRCFYYSLSLLLSKKYSTGRLLGSSNCSAEISALVFCSMVLQQVPVENPKFSKIVNGYAFDFIKLHEELLFK